MMIQPRRSAAVAVASFAFTLTAYTESTGQVQWAPGPSAWAGDLTPLTNGDWNHDRAEHLLGRAGFGGTPEDIQKLAEMTPEAAVRFLVYYDSIANDHLLPFEHSGFWDESLAHFPPSRPAAKTARKPAARGGDFLEETS